MKLLLSQCIKLAKNKIEFITSYTHKTKFASQLHISGLKKETSLNDMKNSQM